MKSRLAALLVVAICVPLAAPALAGAQQVDPTSRQYRDQLTQINQGANPPSNPPGTTASTGTGSGLDGRVGPLPFTGFDVIAMVAVALAVTGLGLALQRAVSRDPGDKPA